MRRKVVVNKWPHQKVTCLKINGMHACGSRVL
jgi:hypothetical protein